MRPETQELIGKIGMGIGFVGFLIGMAAAITVNPIIGGIATVLGLSLFGYFILSPIIRRRREKGLMESGNQAQVRIVELWDTGVTLNNSPQIAMTVEVTPEAGPVFRSKIKKFISRLDTYEYREGMYCVVRYDPNNTSNIMIVSTNN